MLGVFGLLGGIRVVGVSGVYWGLAGSVGTKGSQGV